MNNNKEGQGPITFSRRDVLRGMAIVGTGAVATAVLGGCKEGPVEVNAYKLPVVKSRIKEDFEDIGVARGTVYEMKVEVSGIGDIGFALVENQNAPGEPLVAFRKNGVGENTDGVFTPAEKYESLVTVVEDKETGARSVYVANVLADPKSEHYGDGFELILIRDGVIDLSGDWESVPRQVHEALKDNRSIRKMTLANPYRPDETGRNFAAEVPGEDLTKLWSKIGGVVVSTFDGLLTGGRVLAQGPEVIKTATLMATATPAATETLTMTVTQTPEPTETPVPPTATPEPHTATPSPKKPEATATEEPTVQPSPTATKQEATPVSESGEVLIGTEFIGLAQEDIARLMDLPENEGKIPFPGNADTSTTTKFIEKRGGTGLLVYGMQGSDVNTRILYNPSNKKIVKSVVPGYVSFILEDRLTITILTPKVISSPDSLEAGSLGEELASGFPNQSDPDAVKDSGEYVMVVYKNDPNDGTKFLKVDPRLMYKGRWVCWKP